MNQAKLQSFSLLVGRIGLGLVMLYYGSQKALGVFGGAGIQGWIEIMHRQHHVGQALTILNIIAEFLGSIGLIVGFLTRFAAFGILSSMAVAAFFAFSHGNFVSALQAGDGRVVSSVFYPLSLGIFALMFVISGAGDLSLDRKFFGKKRR